MSTVTIKLVHHQFMGEFYFRRDQVATARSLQKDGWYESCEPFIVSAKGARAAEEAFDLTNNPYRQDERERLYGRGRSVSVGDIVNVDGVDFVCCSEGWKKA